LSDTPSPFAPLDRGVEIRFSSDDRLFHYTSTGGLYGILASNTLWATHFQFLNDTQEFRAAQNSLGNFFREKMLARLAALKVNGKIQVNENVVLRDLADEEAKKIVKIFYDVVFSHIDPFVLSAFLCSKDDERHFRDGNLQHWATYGRGAGFALQIDPTRLCELFKQESEKFAHGGFFGGPVEYVHADHAPRSMRDEYATLASIALQLMESLLDDDAPKPDIESSFLPFNRVNAFIKNSYFSHEREGRVAFYRHKSIPRKKKSHDIHMLVKGAHGVPYIHLFEGKLLGSESPIERIIIGPHPENSRRRSALETYLASKNWDIEVSESNIPYLVR
jgi:hypothetical protein